MEKKIINKERVQAVAEFMENWTCDYLALIMRRFMHEAIKMSFETEQDTIKKEWISDGYYFLTKISEILDPQLEKE